MVDVEVMQNHREGSSNGDSTAKQPSPHASLVSLLGWAVLELLILLGGDFIGEETVPGWSGLSPRLGQVCIQNYLNGRVVKAILRLRNLAHVRGRVRLQWGRGARLLSARSNGRSI